MWTGEGDPSWDKERWDRSILSHHAATVRVEVWADGTLLSEAAPIHTGEVTDEHVIAGVRRHLNLSVPASRSWLRWLDYGSLEIRPFRGVRCSPRLTMECPLGRFPLQPPEMTLPLRSVTLTANDYGEYLEDAGFTARGPVMRPAGKLSDGIAWLIRGAGLPQPIITATTGSSKAVLLEGTRIEAIVDAAEASTSEVYFDRLGRAVITDSVGQGAPTSRILTGTGGAAVGVRQTPDWSKVFNEVTVESSATDVEIPVAVAAISNTNHPAHPYRLGTPSRPRRRTYPYSSPLITTYAQALKAATTILGRVSARAEVITYEAFPDASRDGGDTALGATVRGGTRVAQLASVTHPLHIGDNVTSTVVTVNTQPEAT